MRFFAMLCACAALQWTAMAHAADKPASAFVAARGASQAGETASPAVKAAENAEMPGDLRPEKRAVPQISIPLKGKTGQGAAPAAGDANAIDDDAARCLAKKTKAERARCQRVGDQARPAAAKK